MATIGQRVRPSAALRLPSLWWLLLPVSVGLLVITGIIALAQRAQPQFVADLTQPFETLEFEVVGMNLIEQKNGERYRWTTDYAFAQVRHGYHLAPFFNATIAIRSDRPDGPQPVSFLVNEQPLVTAPTTKNEREYHVLLPHWPDAEASLRVATATKNLKLPNDRRRLGFISTEWALNPIFGASRVSPLQPYEILSVTLGGVALLLWLWFRAGRRTALSVGLSVPLVLLALRSFYEPAPISYEHLALIGLLAVAALPLLTRSTPIMIGLAAISLVVTFSGALWRSWITDDALISFRYAQNLVAGNGLVYNVGERVEGYTNFLWTMLSALVLALGGDPIYVSYYAGIGLALLLVATTFIFVRRVLGEGWGLAAAALLGTSHSLLLYTARGSGLETGLFALLVLLGSYAALRERLVVAGILFALATMTRPEGVLLLGIAGLVRLMTQRRIDRGIWQMVAAFALIGVPFFAWRFAYYGDLLPNTFYAKTGGGLAQAWRGVEHVWDFMQFAGGPLLGLMLSGAAIYIARCWRTKMPEFTWLLFAWLVVLLYTAYIVAVGGDHFPGFRFFVPILPFLALLLAAGMRALIAPPVLGRAGALIAVVLVLIFSVFNLTRSTPFEYIVRGDDESLWLWREIGWWMGDNGQAGESIAAMGAGAIPYYSNYPTVDLLGLNDRYIARLSVANMGTGVAGHEKRDPPYVLNVRKPTYIPGLWAEYFGGIPALRATGQYERFEGVTRYGRRVELWKRVP